MIDGQRGRPGPGEHPTFSPVPGEEDAVGSPTPPGTWIWPVALSPAENWLRRHYGPGAVVLVALVVVNELYGRGTDLLRWDWLFITGYLTFLAGLRITLELPVRVHQALGRLTARQVLVDQRADFPAFEHRIHSDGRRAALLGGAITPVVMLLAWILAKRGALPSFLLTAAGEVVASVPVGFFFGRAISYGRLGRRLGTQRFVIDIDPEHLDGAGGLRPIGDLYFFQAMLLAVPAVFLGAWWFVIPFFDGYADWRNVYAGLLVPVLCCEALAFLLPMRSFHRIMQKAKGRLLDEADRISHEVLEMQKKLRHVTDEAERERIAVHVGRLSGRYAAIDGMRTWPIDIRIRRRFALSNTALFIPVLAQVLGAPDSWQQLLDAVQKVVSGQG